MEDKKELIAHLRKIQADLVEWGEKNEYVKGGWQTPFFDEVDEIRKELGALPKIPSVVGVMPVAPLPEDYCDAIRKKNEAEKKRIKYCGIAAIVSVVLMVIAPWQLQSLIWILTMGSVGATVFFWYKNRSTNEEFVKKEKAYQEAAAQSEKSMARFQEALDDYDRECKAGMKAAEEYGMKYRQALISFTEAIGNMIEKRSEAEAQKDELTDSLAHNGLVEVSQLHCIVDIIELLENGQANSLEEALAMIDDED